MFQTVPLPSPVRLLNAERRPGDQKTTDIWLAAGSRSAACPLCQRRSHHVHSHYERTLTDLPCADCSVVLHLRVRRFFCMNRRCPRRIFAERFPQLAAKHAQRTQRVRHAQTQLAQAVGSRPGARLATLLAMPVSASTLLRLERAAPAPSPPTPRVLGVDDWAFKKGHRYGTLLYDLERHQVVDLLADRTAETLAAWLKAHPGVEIISRDRAEAYAEGARQGAPEAVQVADRWHLVKNLGQALETVAGEKPRLLREAAQPSTVAASNLPPSACNSEETRPPRPPRQAQSRIEQQKHTRRQARLERFEHVRALYAQGCNIGQIARSLNLSPKTVRAFAYAVAFPERKERASRPCRLDAYRPYLRQRWQEGCHNGAQLFRELRARGYRGGNTQVRDYLLSWRHTSSAADVVVQQKVSARQVAMWSLRRPSDRTVSQQALLERLQHLSEPFRRAFDLVERFLQLVRQSPRGNQAEALRAWQTAARESGVAALGRFAVSLQQDQAAVEAGLSLSWSNGAVEGSNNRLKFLKRRGYGRASFDLLRARVLHPT